MQPFNRINPILTQVSFPVFAKIKNDDAQLRRAYRKGVRLLVAVNSPLLFGLIAVAPILMPALLGPGWDDSVAVVRILSIVVLLRSANNINVGLILAKEKYRWPMYLNLVLLVLVPSTIFVAAGLSHSLVVVSWAIVVVQGCVSVGVYVMFVRRLLGGLGLAYLGDVGRPIIAGALMAGVLVWLQAEVDELQGWPGLLVLVPLGGVVYGAVSLVIQRQHMRELFAVARGYA
jgi:O-antigen/teichoic acid export membrane protein